MQKCNSEFIFSISLTVILLNLYNANAIVSRKLLHKNGVKGIHKFENSVANIQKITN